MYTYPILVFALLVSLASSFTYPLSQTFDFNATLGTKIFTFQSNLKNQATFDLVTSVDLVWCFQIQLSLVDTNTSFPAISNNSVYWNNVTCSQYLSTSGNASVSLSFEMVPYAVAVFFKNATGLTTAPSVSFTLGKAGDSCPLDKVSLPSGDCVDFTQITGDHQAVPGLSVLRYSLSTVNLTSQFSIGCNSNTSDLEFWIARDNSPQVSGTKYSCASHANVQYPRGLFGYYILVNNTRNETQTLTLTQELCPKDMGGPGCTIKVFNASFAPSITLINETIYYFQINATAGENGNAVWISTRGVNGSNTDVPNPIIFASLNQLPQPDNADIGGCTQQFCDYVNVIHFNVSANQTWYVGIRNRVQSLNGSIAGVWFNSLCAPDCIDHGNCQLDGPAAGYCQCIDGFIGVDCGTPNGFGPQFIVLIIIAVLVALTAVIGFGAWAYMRRKRGQYDIVS